MDWRRIIPSVTAAAVITTSAAAQTPLPDCTTYDYDTGGFHGPSVDPACSFGGLQFSWVTMDSDHTVPFTFSFAKAGNAVTLTARPTGGWRYNLSQPPGGIDYDWATFSVSAWSPTVPVIGLYGTYGPLNGWLGYTDPVFTTVLRATRMGTGIPGYQDAAITQGRFSFPGGRTPNALSAPVSGLNAPITFQTYYSWDTFTMLDQPTAWNPPYPDQVNLQYDPAWSATFVLAGTTTPEPSTWVLLASGLVLLMLSRGLSRRG